MQDKIKIIIAAHKQYQMPKEGLYLPLHVGKYGKESIGFMGDDTGDNISMLNSSYCELTGLYWAWKNLNSKYIGLVHYRRYFSNKTYLYRKLHSPFDSILSQSETEKLVKEYELILPKKRHYYIETLYSHYIHTHEDLHLQRAKAIISKLSPEYTEFFDKVLWQRSGYMFNMFIMNDVLLDNYCSWLFAILSELDKEIDSSTYSSFNKRYLGRISELLFNIWLAKQKDANENLRIKEIPYIHIEKIDWNKKIKSFLKAKFLNKKYESSF